MTDIEFYNLTKNFLERKAVAYGLQVTDLDKYYDCTDPKMDWYRRIGGTDMCKAFAQLAFHAQNATMISSIVKFEKNIDFLKLVCCDFNPTQFKDKCDDYGGDFENKVDSLVEELRYDENTNPNGLKWNREKAKAENKDKLAKRYARALIKGAEYLCTFANKAELTTELLANRTPYTRAGVTDENKNLIDYFMNKMGETSGFSVALTCDYLKELSVDFDFLAKPDIHIMDVLEVVKSKGEDYYKYGESRARECLRDFQAMVENINCALREEGQPEITVYKFDRMIWLVCAGKFFLDNVGLDKDNYIADIKRHL